MPGRFEGVSGAERKLSEDIFPGKAGEGREMPAVHQRKVLNPLRFILAVCREACDGHQEVQAIVG